MNLIKYEEDCYTLENLTRAEMEAIVALVNNVKLGEFTDASNACEALVEEFEKAEFHTQLEVEIQDMYGDVLEEFTMELV